MSAVPIPLEQFDQVFGSTSTEISSVALGGRVLSTSDEWFAPASSLLKVGPAPSLKGTFGPKGALFDGWETRRHNSSYDWVVLRLGPKAGGKLIGFDVDTANFSGNEAPEIAVFGLALTPEEEAKVGNTLAADDKRWQCLVPVSPCGPSQRHLFKLVDPNLLQSTYTHIKLHMIPDGGIARFRVYGNILPAPLGHAEGELADPKNQALNLIDLAHCLNGGRVVFTDDQHFGAGSNIILPGRGKDMGDGWETRRSRAKGHFNWAIIQLGEPGFLSYAEIDTAHFLGNYPESAELLATSYTGADEGAIGHLTQSATWTTLLPRSKLGPGRRHFFALHNGSEAYTHVMVKMIPDGGIKRVRLVGRRVSPVLAAGINPKSLPTVALPEDVQDPLPSAASDPFAPVSAATSLAPSTLSSAVDNKNGITLHGQHLAAVRLVASAFAPYGSVIDGPASHEAPRPFKVVNQGTAQKFLNLASIQNLYPAAAQAQTNVHVYRCDPARQLPFDVKLLERHRFTTQAFIPMTPTVATTQPQHDGYLVVVASNGQDDRPDLSTLAVFLATTEQGIQYHPGVWHHPMIALGSSVTDFACIVNESQLQPHLDCDEVEV